MYNRLTVAVIATLATGSHIAVACFHFHLQSVPPITDVCYGEQPKPCFTHRTTPTPYPPYWTTPILDDSHTGLVAMLDGPIYVKQYFYEI